MDKKDQVYSIIADKMFVETDELNDDTTLQDDLGVDSFDMLEIIIELETVFKMEISDDARDVKTVGDLVKLVEV